MKMTMKRALALLIALLLAVPNFALAELPETFIESVQVESEYGDTEMALGEDAGDASADAGTGSVSADLYDPTPVEAVDDIPAAPSDASEIAAEDAPEEGDIAGAPEGGDVEGQPEEGELLDLPEEDLPEEGQVEEGQAGEEQPEDAGEAMSEPFNRSEVLDGVIVTVQAAPGVFPNDATLSVTHALPDEQRKADAAVDAAREAGRNVAALQGFDDPVILTVLINETEYDIALTCIAQTFEVPEAFELPEVSEASETFEASEAPVAGLLDEETVTPVYTVWSDVECHPLG